MVYYEEYRYVNDAIAREKELKKWRREKKVRLINTINPDMSDLCHELFKCYDLTANEIKEIADDLKSKYKITPKTH